MTLQKWAEYGWLRSHKTSKKEIADLLRIIDRDLQDAAGDISADWRFGIAYNAALKLCTILLYAGGYRPEKNLQHYRTIQPKSTTNFSQSQDRREFTNNFHAPQFAKTITIYAVNSIVIKCWW